MERYEQWNKSFINGEWVEGESSRTYDILNPYDRSVVASVPLATVEQLHRAFEAASEAQKEWGRSSAAQRKEVLHKAMAYLQANREEIVDLIVRETGGTLLKANVEFHLALELLEEALHYVDEVGAVKEVPSNIEGKVNYIYRLPLGVIASISPFNFPLNLSLRTIVPAIALGNTVVHKPDIQVGLVGGVVIARAFEYAGLPKGVLNVLLTDIDEIGDEMLINPHSRLISFTGSTAVGRRIGEIAGRQLKRVALELGGNSPFVVLSDADIDQAVNAAIFGKFIHQGQICMIINRIIVHESKYDEFVEKFVQRAAALPYGDPRDPSTVIGPIINEKQMQKALQMIEEAKREGIRMALEGKRIGNVLTPYVFVDVDPSSKLAQTELFAPIAVVIKAKTDEEAIAIANQTEYGLSSAIFTSDVEKGKEWALQIDSGMTHINDQTVNDAPNIPFGGNKASGLGRFGNPWVVDEFTTVKWVSVQTKARTYPF
ncbi:aldehyde dehydrogenase family protein [Geobacillus thermoleovorans]|uniref:Aldehyde dehydrogenase n=1 Tax=Geobacillus kaustophilus GBlys TaxID=1337888 RepID=U2WWU3_GEOKU|nr:MULTISPECIES: aldehyde dehydrogenase family protein [Geobacillus thermoleovorans group]UPT59223.1 aldehyde dehydrogenase family protein [Geobacillus thermoleovorans]GAD15396.1 aldehyde dehydrogenase [Geobacillus kaustophilus GBlys]